MRSPCKAIVPIAAFGLGLALPTMAAAQSTKSKPAKDPNEMVCEKLVEPGSRLATKRVCHTRAEWAEIRRLDRMDLERSQTQRGKVSD